MAGNSLSIELKYTGTGRPYHMSYLYRYRRRSGAPNHSRISSERAEGWPWRTGEERDDRRWCRAGVKAAFNGVLVLNARASSSLAGLAECDPEIVRSATAQCATGRGQLSDEQSSRFGQAARHCCWQCSSNIRMQRLYCTPDSVLQLL